MHFHSFITLSLMSTTYALSIPGNGARDMPIVGLSSVIAPASGAYKAPRAYSHASASVTPTATSSIIPSSTPLASVPSEVPVATEPPAVRAAIRNYHTDYIRWEAATGEAKEQLRARVQHDVMAIRNIKAAIQRQPSAGGSVSASASATVTPRRR
ncbi:hypothetical protein N7466_005792 [Penicillium verhagenii]|uniref:uncharacterized protein n=1 Tax=Penicillium verhagenii TaxID=1562060 RepID=UPI0025458233|nr:uncharacterized protein N7466_005792 [Penicillium verhagenii]KAJ5930299.1 hypothetical protein N7466_005792 [Penicillium verhagenii]